MKVTFSATPEALCEEKKCGLGSPPEANLFIRLCFPTFLSAAAGSVTIGVVPLARFALEILHALYRFHGGDGSSEYFYRDFYGGLTLRLQNSRDGILIENPDTGESVRVPRDEAAAGFSEFGRSVVGLVEEAFPEAPGIDDLKEAIERCAAG